MARPLRIEYAGAVYHITSRGTKRKPVFKNDQDRLNFLNTLQHVNKRNNWICHAYDSPVSSHLPANTQETIGILRSWPRLAGTTFFERKPVSRKNS
jgi:hypothetical protein